MGVVPWAEGARANCRGPGRAGRGMERTARAAAEGLVRGSPFARQGALSAGSEGEVR